MVEEKQLSESCLLYEMFIKKAYGSYIRQPVMEISCMRELMVAEKKNEVSFDSLINFEILLLEIKKHMEQALESYMAKPTMPRYIIDELRLYKEQVVWAVSSDELMRIIVKTIDLTVNLSLDME